MPSHYCEDCGAIVPARDWRRHQAQHRGRARARAGERNGSPPGWRKLRLTIIERDGHRCTVPGCERSTGLEVHHVDGNWRNNDPANLRTRCPDHNPRGRPTTNAQTPAGESPRPASRRS